jgi:hypothetical protein
VDRVENLTTGIITTLGRRDPFGLDSDTEALIKANRVEVRTDQATGRSLTTVGTFLVQRARLQVRDSQTDREPDPDELLVVEVDQHGSLFLTQEDPTTTEASPRQDAAKARGRVEWTLPSLFRLLTRFGPIDLDAGRGFRLKVTKGFTLAGPAGSSITVTPEGEISLTGRALNFSAYDQRASFTGDDFRAEEDDIADQREAEQELLRRAQIDIAILIRGEFDALGRVIVPPRFPARDAPRHPVDAAGHFKQFRLHQRYGTIDEIQEPDLQAFVVAVRKRNRDIEWFRRRELLNLDQSLAKVRADLQKSPAAVQAALASRSLAPLDRYKRAVASRLVRAERQAKAASLRQTMWIEKRVESGRYISIPSFVSPRFPRRFL